MDWPVIWPVVRAGNSPDNGSAVVGDDSEEDEEKGEDVVIWQCNGSHTCLVPLFQLNETVDEVSWTWDYAADHPAQC